MLERARTNFTEIKQGEHFVYLHLSTNEKCDCYITKAVAFSPEQAVRLYSHAPARRYDNETADVVTGAVRHQEGEWWGRKHPKLLI